MHGEPISGGYASQTNPCSSAAVQATRSRRTTRLPPGTPSAAQAACRAGSRAAGVAGWRGCERGVAALHSQDFSINLLLNGRPFVWGFPLANNRQSIRAAASNPHCCPPVTKPCSAMLMACRRAEPSSPGGVRAAQVHVRQVRAGHHAEGGVNAMATYLCFQNTHFTNSGWPAHGTGWNIYAKLVFRLTCYPRQMCGATDIAAAVGPCQPHPLQRLQAQWRSSRQGSLQGPRWTQSAVHSGASVGARPSKTRWCLHATLPATVCTHKVAAATGQQGRLPRVEQRLQQILHTGSGFHWVQG